MSIGMIYGIVIIGVSVIFTLIIISKDIKNSQANSTKNEITSKITQEEYGEEKTEYLENIEEISIKENDENQPNNVIEKNTNKKFSIMSRKLALVGVVLILVGIIGGGYNLKEANYYRGRALSYNASDEYKEKGIYGSRVGIEQASGYVNLYDAYSYYNANNKYNEKIEKQRYYRDKEDTYKKYAYAFFGVSVFGVVLIIVDKRKISGKGKIKIQISKS